MLRVPIAQLLHGDVTMLASLAGGIWPQEDEQASAMTREDYPTAFDSQGLIKPTALVQDDGSFSLPTHDRVLTETFRIILWQYSGRDVIDGALKRIFELLQGVHLQADTLWVYQLQWAGNGPNLKDGALNDAELGWSRWQAVVLR